MSTLFGLPVALDALIRVLIIVGVMTVVVMGLIYIERKVLARFQQRLGPTRTGPMGLLQSVADALKLVAKEDVRPTNADPWGPSSGLSWSRSRWPGPCATSTSGCSTSWRSRR